MKEIKQVLESQSASIESLLNCFEQVKNDGNVAVIKFDGERSEMQYTVFISFPQKKDEPILRADRSSLTEALKDVLKSYIQGE